MADALQLLGDATDVSNSLAIVGLDTLVEEGRLIEERADYLKERFKELHNRVLLVYKRDNFLLKRARNLRKELDAQKENMAARGKVAQEDDAEIQRLKSLLLEAKGELTSSQERESILQVEVLEFDRKKHTMLLEREDALAAEEAQLRPLMESIREEMAVTGSEIEEMTAQYKLIEAKRAELLAQELGYKEDLANYKANLSEAVRQLANVDKLPDHSFRQMQVVLRSYQAAQLEVSALDEKLGAQADLISKLELKKDTRSSEYEKATANLQKLKSHIDSKRVTLDTLNTSLDMEQEARQGYQHRIGQLEHLIKATHIARDKELGEVESVRRDIHGAGIEYSELEVAIGNVVSEQHELKERIDGVKKKIDRVQAARKRNAERLEEARRDIDLRKRVLVRENHVEKEIASKVESLDYDIELLKKEIVARSIQEEAKRREVSALVQRRQELNREKVKGRGRIIMGKNELRIKDMYVADARKRWNELEHRLKSMIDTFQHIKRERTHKAAQIQAVTQRMTEMTEKKAILENELVVLCRESALKEAELAKKRRQVQELRQAYKNLRMEKNRQRKSLEKAREEERNIKNDVRRVAGHITDMEEKMDVVKQSYQDIIESRDYVGVQLLDRNDELCVMYERLNAQEKAVREGVLMDNARVEEIRMLKIQLTDIHREVDLLRLTIPKVKELEMELTKITDEIDDERWKVEVLENDLTNPRNPHRWRLIDRKTGGRSMASRANASQPHKPANSAPQVVRASGVRNDVDGPSDEYVELQQRYQQLEESVNILNERIREKDLILEEVTELSSRLEEQAKSGREVTLSLAKRVNFHHNNIRVKTRQMMAIVSELSVFQASAIQLQQDVQRLEGVVEEAERLVAQGEAPFAEAEERYAREVGARMRYSDMLRRKKEEAALENAGLTATVAMIEQRPNAYIPDSDLSIPMPFGALMPFKPTPLVQPIRYYKPQLDRYYEKEKRERVSLCTPLAREGGEVNASTALLN
ncbi:hypothetical protein ERJ75_001410400 [Trypanosoma vivax]|uniref:Cilia- and flagella-associated protein 58 central coiled coil domain-containing protein n=1 Tax=Trypanosoma vivax (strain Y486) TaxID=1055687 RepID=G0TU93_TRYVY|nr:hypothetical protein ERJ75_001410400 [Trypanosoma vivax]CCC47527.1 conserved hypothetical protein [Trypanosoma vivax Y486]